MKRVYSLLSAVLAFVACQNVGLETDSSEVVEGNSGQEFKEVIITASIADGQQVSRTTYNEDEAKNYWTPGDKIKVFSAGYTSEFTSINTAPAPVVNFKGVVTFISGSSNDDDDSKYYVWGLYPYSDEAVYEEPDGISRTARITTTYPDAQVGVAGTFGDGLSVMIGRSESLSIPFRGAYSGAFFQVSRDDIVSMTLRGLNGETLAGTATIGLNSALTPVVHSVADPKESVTVTAPNGTFEPGVNYYLVTLPDVALPDGYSVTLERSDGSYGTYEVRANRPLNRIKFRNLSEPVDVRIENENNIANGTSTGWMRPDGNIVFADPKVKSICVENWDTDGDGELSYDEAANVTEIARDVFSGNKEITSFDEFSYFIGLKTLPQSCFLGCSTLSSIVLPVSLRELPDYIFYNCSSLESIDIPSSVKNIGRYVFQGCSSLATVSLHEGLNAIGPRAFFGCSSLSTLRLPGTVTSIESEAFSGCTGLLTITIPDSVTSIGSAAFSGCTGLSTITIPGSVSHVSRSLFKDCTSLRDVIFSEGVESLGYEVFNGCSDVSVTIPTTLSSFTEKIAGGGSSGSDYSYSCGAFYKASLNTLTIYASQCSQINQYLTTGWSNNSLDYTSFIVKKLIVLNPQQIPYSFDYGYIRASGQIDEIEFASGLETLGTIPSSKLKSVCLPDGLTKIDGSFGGSSLTSVVIPESVTYIGDNSFSNCKLLENIIIPENVTYLGASAFEGCSKLSELIIPNSVSYIGNKAFSGCSQLISVNIPDNAEIVIGDYAFFNCSNLKTLELPNSTVGTIGTNAFSGCSSLKTLILPNGLTGSVGWSAFYNCSSLTTLILPEGLTGPIDNYAFDGCTGLTSIVIPNNVTSISSYAFRNCNSLSSMVIPEGVTSIGGYAYYGCSGLTNIVIPDSVESIGEYAFFNCTGLTSITVLPLTPPELNSRNPFNGTYPIFVPSGSLDEYKTANNWSTYASRIQAIVKPFPEGTSFDPDAYITYVSNHQEWGNLSTEQDYMYDTQFSTNVSGTRIEMKFQIPNYSSGEAILSQGSHLGNGLAIDASNVYQVRFVGKHKDGDTWYDQAFDSGVGSGIDGTGVVVLTASCDGNQIVASVNGNETTIPVAVSSWSFNYLFSYYDYEGGDGSKDEYLAGVPDGAKLYYVKIWNGDDLVYFGHASRSVCSFSSEEEYCWYEEVGNKYTFARNLHTLASSEIIPYQPISPVVSVRQAFGGGID